MYPGCEEADLQLSPWRVPGCQVHRQAAAPPLQQGQVPAVSSVLSTSYCPLCARPACEDKSEIFNLTCSGGGVPSLGVGTFPRCAQGNLLCQDGAELRCLVAGQLTDEVPNFGM